MRVAEKGGDIQREKVKEKIKRNEEYREKGHIKEKSVVNEDREQREGDERKTKKREET